MNEPFDPYYTWLGIPQHEQPANFYRLLGVQLFEPNQRVIENAAARQMMLLRSFQNGPNSGASQHLLNEVSAARGWLLDPQKKAAYDQQLGHLLSSLRPSFQPPLPPPRNVVITVAPQARQPTPVAVAPPNASAGIPTVPLNRQSSSRRVRRNEGIALSQIVQIIVGGVAGSALAVFAVFYFTGSDILGWSVRSRDQPQLSEKPRTHPDNSSQSAKPSVNKRPTQEVARTGPLPEPAQSSPPVNSGTESVTNHKADWRYGYGRLDSLSRRLVEFKDLTGGESWVASTTKYPADGPLDYICLEPDGGHPGSDPAILVVRRWRSPVSGAVDIQGEIKHPYSVGDGIRAYVITSRSGVIWSSLVHENSVRITEKNIQITEGETIDFCVNCNQGNFHDHFVFRMQLLVRRNAPQSSSEVWDSFKDFRKPSTTSGLLGPETASNSRESRVATAAKPKDETASVVTAPVAPTPTIATAKNDPPDNSQRELAQKQIAEVFGTEIAGAKTTPQKLELAKKLLGVGRETRGDAPARFLLYEQAAEIAASCADVETTMQAADAMLEEFTRVDELTLKESLLRKAAAAPPRNPAQHAAIASAALELADEAITEDKLEAADRFWKLTLSERNKITTEPIPKIHADVVSDTLELLQSQAAAYRTQREVLEFEPTNPEANLIVGRYLLFGKRQRQGLLHLQKGSDETLKRLADLEAMEKLTPAEVYSLADGWKAQAEGAKNAVERRTMLELALIAYRRSAEGLVGLDRVRAGKQIERLTKEGVGDTPLLRSLDLSKPKGEKLSSISKEFPKKGRAILTNSLGMKLAYIPPGEFLMGSPEDEEGRYPDEFQHKVKITKPFYMGVYEVTQEEYLKLIRTNARNEYVPETARYPIELVSWEDAVNFCEKLSAKEGKTYRLPTEAEWEYACRAGTTTPFHFGNELNGNRANCNGDQPYGADVKGKNLGRPTTVGSYASNAFGLFDMHGNVREWCSDYFEKDYYHVSPVADPSGPAFGSERVVRGGGWDLKGSFCRAAFRTSFLPTRFDARNDLGFRVVQEVNEPVGIGGLPRTSNETTKSPPPSVLSNDEVIDSLGLSQAQREMLSAIGRVFQTKEAQLSANLNQIAAQDRDAVFVRLRLERNAEIFKVLTGAQKTKLAKLMGKSFDPAVLLPPRQ